MRIGWEREAWRQHCSSLDPYLLVSEGTLDGKDRSKLVELLKPLLPGVPSNHTSGYWNAASLLLAPSVQAVPGAMPRLQPSDELKLFDECERCLGRTLYDVFLAGKLFGSFDRGVTDVLVRNFEAAVVVIKRMRQNKGSGSGGEGLEMDLNWTLQMLTKTLVVVASMRCLHPELLLRRLPPDGKPKPALELALLFMDSRDSKNPDQLVFENQLFAISSKTALKATASSLSFFLRENYGSHEMSRSGTAHLQTLLACRGLTLACCSFSEMLENLGQRGPNAGASETYEAMLERLENVAKVAPTRFLEQVTREWKQVTQAWERSTKAWPLAVQLAIKGCGKNKENPKQGASQEGSELEVQVTYRNRMEDSMYATSNSPTTTSFCNSYREAMKCICEGFPTFDGEAWNAEDHRFQTLFSDTANTLGDFLFEFSDDLKLANSLELPSELSVSEVVEKAIKALYNCKNKGKMWAEEFNLCGLGNALRNLAERLVKAAWYLLNDNLLTVNLRGRKVESDRDGEFDIRASRLGFAHFTTCLLNRDCYPADAWKLATLCKTVHGQMSSFLHEKDPKAHHIVYNNIGNTIIIGCRCAIFACQHFACLFKDRRKRVAQVDVVGPTFSEHMHCLRETGKADLRKDHIKTYFKQFKAMTEAHMHAIKEPEGNRFICNFVDALNCNEESSGDIKMCKLLTEILYIDSALKEECKETSSVKWLHRIISGEDREHQEYIRRKLESVIDLLGSKSGDEYADLKQEVDTFSRERKELQECNQKALSDLDLGPGGHIEDLPKIVMAISDGHMSHFSDVQGEQREALFQAAAYVQARSDKGEHLGIDHPDLLVLWHRSEALKHNWNVDWSVFRRCFPAELVVPSSQKDKIMRLVDKILDPLEKRLTGNLQAAKDLQAADEQVTIDSINKVFQWNALRRMSILEALEECQKLNASSALSSASSMLSGASSVLSTNSGPSTPFSSGSLEKTSSPFSRTSLTALPSFQETEFVGRDAELKHVVNLLTANQQPTKRHILLSGPSGIGKTTLGDKVTEELEGKFQVINVDFFSTDANTSGGVYERFLSALGIKSTKAGDAMDAKADIIHRLKHYKSSRPGTSRRLLLRLEACEIPLANDKAAKALLGLLRDASKRVAQVSVLMAVRTPDSDDNQLLHRFLAEGFKELFEQVALATLDQASAVSILRERFQGGEHEHEAKELADLCGRVPLQLKLTASVLSAGRVQYEELKNDLAQSKGSEGSGVERAILKWHDDMHLRALFRLSHFTSSFDAGQAFSMLHGLKFPEELLQELYSLRLVLAKTDSGSVLWTLHDNVKVAIKAIGNSTAWEERQSIASTLFAECMMAELRKSARAASRGNFSLATRHALTQQANICAALGPAAERVDVCTAVSQALLRSWCLFCTAGWVSAIGRVAALLLPSLEQLTLAARSAVQKAAEVPAHGATGTPAHGALEVPAHGAHGAPEVLEPGASKDQEAVGSTIADEEQWKRWMSDSIMLLHEDGALGLHFEVDACLPQKQRVLTDVLSLYGSVLFLNGEVFEAEGKFREELELRCKIMGLEHRSTLNCMRNLAGALNCQHKLDQAEEKHREVLELSSKMLGERHADTLASKSHVATALGSQGKSTEAEAIHREVLQLRREVLGDEHPDTLASMYNVACASASLNKRAEAEEMYRKVLDLQCKELSLENPNTLASMYNLAHLLSDQGKYADAEHFYKKALMPMSDVHGPEHSIHLGTMSNLADVLGHQGKWEEVEKVLRKRLKLLGKAQESLPCTLTTMHGIAQALENQGKWEEVERAYRFFFGLLNKEQGKVLSKEGPEVEESDMLAIMVKFAHVQEGLYDYDGVVMVYRELSELMGEVMGLEHSNPFPTMYGLANALLMQYKLEEAEMLFKVLTLLGKDLWPDHLALLDTIHGLLRALERQGKWEEVKLVYIDSAEELLQLLEGLAIERQSTQVSENLGKWDEVERVHMEMLKVSKIAFGPSHPNTNDINNMIRDALQEAVSEFTQEVEKRRQTLGPEHPGTSNCEWNLFIALEKLEEIDGLSSGSSEEAE